MSQWTFSLFLPFSLFVFASVCRSSLSGASARPRQVVVIWHVRSSPLARSAAVSGGFGVGGGGSPRFYHRRARHTKAGGEARGLVDDCYLVEKKKKKKVAAQPVALKARRGNDRRAAVHTCEQVPSVLSRWWQQGSISLRGGPSDGVNLGQEGVSGVHQGSQSWM